MFQRRSMNSVTFQQLFTSSMSASSFSSYSLSPLSPTHNTRLLLFLLHLHLRLHLLLPIISYFLGLSSPLLVLGLSLKSSHHDLSRGHQGHQRGQEGLGQDPLQESSEPNFYSGTLSSSSPSTSPSSSPPLPLLPFFLSTSPLLLFLLGFLFLIPPLPNLSHSSPPRVRQ